MRTSKESGSPKNAVSLPRKLTSLDTFILEEYEKVDRLVPKWKIDWVKKIIDEK